MAEGADAKLRQPGQLKEQHVPGPQQLRGRAQLVKVSLGMRGVQNDQMSHRPWRVHGQIPGNHPAPVMADDGGAIRAQRLDQALHIPCQEVQPVLARALGLVGEVIAPQVRRHDPVPRFGQRRQLVAPGIPVLRKSVQQHDQRALAILHVMQSHAIDGGVTVQGGLHGIHGQGWLIFR